MTLKELETGTESLKAQIENGVLTLTMNRPEARNAMTHDMVIALSDQLTKAETNDDVRCIVLTGAGKGFCAGGDVKGMAADDNDNPVSTDGFIHLQRLAQRTIAGTLFKMPKPTIAAINGHAAGAGMSLALACDLKIMSSSAFLTTAFVNVGLSGDFGGTYFITQLIGAAKARELYLLSERVGANEAVDLGLVNWQCAPEELDEKTAEFAARLASGPGVAYRYIKENLNRAITGNVDDCLDLEATHHVHCIATTDHKEAVSAFIEKRTPAFIGR